MKLLNYAALAAVLALSICAPARSATWTEGVNYFLIDPVRPTSLPPGKIEVTEVFSYACPACNVFVPTIHKLKAGLPPNAVLDYLPASFNSSEDWPMFQLAYLTAQTLGVADQTHVLEVDATFEPHRRDWIPATEMAQVGKDRGGDPDPASALAVMNFSDACQGVG